MGGMHISRNFVVALGGLALAAAAVAWYAYPLWVRLSPAQVAEAARWVPLEVRSDRQLQGPVWQRRGGEWYQCKSWISRQFFF
jgi:hypothetical protein